MAETCVQCDHAIWKHGYDWVCEFNCRCLMLGCVPRMAKYGTLLEQQEVLPTVYPSAEEVGVYLPAPEKED